MKSKETDSKKVESQEHQKFLSVTAKLDAASKKGWELSQEKINQMTAAVMEELGYVTKNASSSK
jgi:hypothetical protein